MSLRRDTHRLVLGRYRIIELVGRGGASQVYRADDVQTGQAVAVKEIPIDAEMARRAGAEVRAACRLSHPGVVRLLDFGEDTNACYLVSELVEGATLAERTRDGWVAEHPGATVSIVADVLDGLAHAHERGVTHRDVKPANILVDRTGRGRLADFGIARIAGEAGLTTIGGLVGTVSYMAPEQARGENTGPPADVYSACLVLYEVLAGFNPLVGDSPGDTLRLAAGGDVPSLSHHRPDLPAALCRVVDEGLSPDPAARPSAGWLANTLRAQARVVRGAGPTAHRFGRRLPQVASGIAAGISAAALLHQVTDARPAAIAAASAGVGLAFAVAPWPAALGALAAGSIALGLHAPGLAMLVAALGSILVLSLRKHARLVPLAATAPLVGALGVIPVFAAAAGMVASWRARLVVAVTGVTGALAWQFVAGADPAIDGGRTPGVWADVEGVVSPLTVVQRLSEQLEARPSIVFTAGLLVVAALVMPALVKLRHGVPRVLGVAGWIVALLVGVRAFGGSLESALGAFVPGGILVAAWAAGPWRRLRRGADRRATVTLRGTVERLPAQ